MLPYQPVEKARAHASTSSAWAENWLPHNVFRSPWDAAPGAVLGALGQW